MTEHRRLALRVALVISLLAPFVPGVAPAQSGEPSARILVGPDVLASRDGDFPHVELMVAANPRDPRNLVGGAIAFPRPDRDAGCKVYASRDGGGTWTGVELREQVENGGADPQVAFTPAGTAIFACLANVTDDRGRMVSALHVYRSEDGGFTWQGPVELADRSYDHPQITVDATAGRWAGHVYIGVLYGREYEVGVLRSEDDGRSFIGPVEVARGGGYGGGHGLNVTGLGVLADGALAVNWVDFPLDPAARDARPLETGSWMALSEDGGITYGQPRRVATRTYDDPEDAGLASRATGFATWVADASSDRLYQLWADWRSGAARVLVTSSGDRGATWSQPAEVDPGSSGHQFLAAAAVNREGTLGVSWLDTRAAPDGNGYEQRFTASVDGGSTFLPSRAIASAPSRPLESPANARPIFMPFDDGSGNALMTFVSAIGRWPAGGDYMGLAADARGTFHPFWADARGGSFQIWTARVRVERAGEEGAAAAATPDTENRRVNGRVELVSDPASWDPEARVIEVPVRLRNVSDEPIYPPLEIEVVMLGWADLPEELQEFWSERAPEILNADNGETGAGAVFDYTATLGDLEALAPDAVTGARVWRIRRPHDAMAPIQLEIRGGVERR